MRDNIATLKIEEWTLQVREPANSVPHPVILLLHGWTGDETVMWAFGSALPQKALLISPRAPYQVRPPHTGYSWTPPSVTTGRPWVDDYRPAADALWELLTPEHFPAADWNHLSVVGFSQGTGLAYTLAMLYPSRLEKVAILAGFLPKGADALLRNRPLQGKPIFIAHGTEDEMLPVEVARQSATLLQESGAQVTYCEDKVGHRLGPSCYKRYEEFFS